MHFKINKHTAAETSKLLSIINQLEFLGSFKYCKNK